MTSELDKARHELLNSIGDIVSLINDVNKRLENITEWAEKANSPLKDVSVFFWHLKEAYDALDKSRKVTYAMVENYNKGLIPKMFETEGLDMIRVPELGRSFYPVTKMSASFIDRDEGMKWLREIGQGDVIQETVNASTLSSFIKNMIEDEGIDPPEDIVKVNTYSTVGSSKYTPK